MTRDERGAVTAELALALPLLLAVTAALCWLLAVGVGQVRVVDAARETARAVARGDSEAEAIGLGLRVAPEGTAISVARDGDRVVVRASASLPGPDLVSIGAARLTAEAVAAVEEDSSWREAGP